MPHQKVFLNVGTREFSNPREEPLKEWVLIHLKTQGLLAVEIAHFFVESQQAHREILESAPLSDVQVRGQLLVNHKFVSAVGGNIFNCQFFRLHWLLRQWLLRLQKLLRVYNHWQHLFGLNRLRNVENLAVRHIHFSFVNRYHFFLTFFCQDSNLLRTIQTCLYLRDVIVNETLFPICNQSVHINLPDY